MRLHLTLFMVVIFFDSIFSQIATLERTLEIKNIDGISVPYQNGIPLPSFEKQDRKIIDLAGTWKKYRTVADDNISLSKRDSLGYLDLITEAEGKYLADFDDSSWEEKELPAVENEMYEYPTVPEFFSDGVWYRRSFEVEESDSGKFTKLVFLAVNYIADVWINGEYVGYHEGGYTPFAFDVTPYLKYNDLNIIAVRVDVVSWGVRNDVIPHKPVDWFNYGGIIHDVYLEFSNQTSIVRNDIVPMDLDGNLKTKIVIQNNRSEDFTADVTVQIFKADIDSNNIDTEYANEIIGNEISLSGEVNNSLSFPADSVHIWETSLQINNPEIWSPKEPNLYIMKVSITKDSEIIDEYYSQFGIRTVATQGNKFLLNDRVMFLTGIARHEDHPVFGRSLPKDIIYNDLQIVNSLNVNFIRTAHYPNHPYTYLILDRLGRTVMEEIPLWQVDTDEPWNIQNNIRKMHLQMFREMVFRDYNRPSIIMWSTSNECHEETNRLVYNQMVIDDFNQNYDDGRLISQSPAADNPGPTDVTQEFVDIAGWTMYFGIFHGSSYFGGTYNFINQAKIAFPEKPILDTEFGYWSSEDNSSLQEQVTVADETFKAFKLHTALNADGTLNSNGSLMGCTWWCVFDWYTVFQRRGFQSMGLYSMDRQTAKPVASKIKTLYAPYYSNEGVLVNIQSKNDVNPIQNFYELKQNYPNPFNPNTKISYTIPEESKVEIAVYNSIGQKEKTLIRSVKEKGIYVQSIFGESLSSGVYFCRMTAESLDSGEKFQSVIKLLLVK
jgi:beta-galactosidase